MAAITTSGSGFDLKFRLPAPGFLLESWFVAAYDQAFNDFALECLEMPDVSSATVQDAILAPSYLQNETGQKI